MTEYLVVIEKADSNFSAYLPDLPGCVATGETKDETLDQMRDAIAMHIQGLEEDRVSIPLSSSTADYIAF